MSDLRPDNILLSFYASVPPHIPVLEASVAATFLSA
jgi:hypothetical protein